MIKIKSKVIIFNLLVLTGLLLDYIIPHMTDYQAVLPPKVYAIMVVVMPIINIVLRFINPNVSPIVSKDDATQ